MKVGFIGLGLMGNPMAKNILKAGFPLTVYNRTKSKTKELQKLGAQVATSPKALAENSDVIITMVTGPKDVEAVLFGKNGVAKAKRRGQLVIDMSTIGPRAAKSIGKKLGNLGIEFLDAPVTGSTPKATTGELTIFVGGKQKIFNKVKPILMAMGKNLHYMGPGASGQAIKMVNNYILAATITTLAESMVLCDKLNLPRSKATKVLATVPAMSPMMVLKLPNHVKKRYPLLFTTANMKKDLSLALNELDDKKSLLLLNLVEKMYTKANKTYLSNQDFSAIIKIFK